MFRLEPDAEFRTRERQHFLSPDGVDEIELSPAFGEMIATAQSRQPEPMGRAEGRYWWIFEDRVYSTSDKLSRAAVLRGVRRLEDPKAPLLGFELAAGVSEFRIAH